MKKGIIMILAALTLLVMSVNGAIVTTQNFSDGGIHTDFYGQSAPETYISDGTYIFTGEGYDGDSLWLLDFNDVRAEHNRYIQMDFTRDWNMTIDARFSSLTYGSEMMFLFGDNFYFKIMRLNHNDMILCDFNDESVIAPFVLGDDQSHIWTLKYDSTAKTVELDYDGTTAFVRSWDFVPSNIQVFAFQMYGTAGIASIKFEQTSASCTPDWVASVWSSCTGVAGNYTQTKTYSDANNCNMPETKPADVTRSCGKSNNHYGLTTDFAQVADPTNIPNAVYETPYGKIAWVNPISIVGVDLDKAIIIRSDLLFVNRSIVTPSMDSIANVQFQMDRTYDWCVKGFQMYYAEDAYSDIKQLAQAYSDGKAIKMADKSRIGLDCFNASVCKAVTCSQSKVGFQAQHFSGFGVISDPTSSPPGASGGSYTPYVAPKSADVATSTAPSKMDPEQQKKIFFFIAVGIAVLVVMNGKKKK